MAPSPSTVAAASKNVTLDQEGNRSRRRSAYASGNSSQRGAGGPMAFVGCQYSISPAPTTTATAAYTQTEPAIRAASTRAISTAAVAMRVGMLDRRATTTGGWSAFASATSIGNLLRPRPESAHAPLVGGERLVEVRAAEIGPERLGAVELRVGRLPEQEVAEPHLAGGADNQVRVGQPAGVEVTREVGFVELREVRAIARQLVNRIDDLLAAAVV